MPGQDSGQADSERQSSPFSWGDLVQHHVETAGGWAALADNLVHRARGIADAPEDPASVEKGLRRLAKRPSGDGGQYGRWMLRLFGPPADIARHCAHLAQYHRRYADLPTTVRRHQLALWEATPIMHANEAAWLHLGMASVYLRLSDVESCERRLALAEPMAARVSDAAIVEAGLLRARLLTRPDRAASEATLREMAEVLDDEAIDDEEDAACLFARLVGQQAFHLLHPDDGSDPDHGGALALFETVPARPESAFVSYQRCAGRAYCTFHLGDVDEAVALAQEAADHAADGGLVRFRVMAFNQLASMLSGEESRRYSDRAARMSTMLEDDDLLVRTQRHRH